MIMAEPASDITRQAKTQLIHSDVIIIGAGPSGLAAAGALTRNGISSIVLEQHEQLGHSWRNHYDRLHLHTMKRWSALPFLPMPVDYPRYPSRDQVVAYLEAYADHFGIRPRYGEKVLRAQRLDGFWHVKTEAHHYVGAALVVASGYNHRPIWPDFEGRDNFTGSMMHSSSYRNGKPFKGQQVLVVGCGNSGAEIAIDLYECGAFPSLVVRSPIHVLPRELNGIPTQVNSLILSKLPVGLADAIAVKILNLAVGDLSAYGIRRPSIGPARQVNEFGRVPMLDIGTVDLIRQNKVIVRPGVRSLGAAGVTFVNGETHPYDVVILATGYTTGIADYLQESDKVLNEKNLPTRFGEESQIRGLYFIGFRNPITGMLREIDLEARRVSRLLRKQLRRVMV
jgi:thioredoxin reductase